MMRRIPLVSVVIPCLNEEAVIGKCLDSLLGSDYSKDSIEVWVADGMSDDRSREIILEYSRRFPFIHLIDNRKRTQQAALNLGIRHARGDLIIRMDAHCAFAENYISECVRHLNVWGADNVGGRLITMPRENTVLGRAIAMAMSEPFGVGNSRFRVRRDPGDVEPRWVDTVPYSCYRREVFERIGVFNEQLDRSEDAEFHRRMRDAGCKTLFVPSIVSYYYARSDLKSFWSHSLDNGYWAVIPTFYTGRLVVSLRHLVPLLFVTGLLALGMLAAVLPSLVTPFFLLVGCYGLVNAWVSVVLSVREGDLRYLPVLILVFAALHVGYGLGSLRSVGQLVRGIPKLAPRWGTPIRGDTNGHYKWEGKRGWPRLHSRKARSLGMVENTYRERIGDGGSRLRVWILHHYADPPDGHWTGTYDVYRHLASRGHSVTIFTSSFNHYSRREERLRPGETHREQVYDDGLRFVFLRTAPYYQNDWSRVMNMLTYALRVSWFCVRRAERPDVIIGSTPHPFAAWAAAWLARRKKSMFLLELHDLWLPYLIDTGALRARRPPAVVLERLDRWCYRRAERIIALWPHMDDYLEQLGILRERVVWVPMGVPAEASIWQDSSELADDVFRVVWTGHLGPASNVVEVLQAAALLKREGRQYVRFVLIGGGPEEKELRRFAEAEGLTNVDFKGMMPKKDAVAYLRQADVCVASLPDLPTYNRYGTIPSKLLDYLAQGKPVIFIANVDDNPVTRSGAGRVVRPGAPKELATTIATLAGIPRAERRRLGGKGLNYVREHHDPEKLAARIEALIRETARSGARTGLTHSGDEPAGHVGRVGRVAGT